MATFQDALYALWPHGDTKISGLRHAIVAQAPSIFEKYGVNTRTAMLQFMAQISHECGAGLEVEENLNYSADRMAVVWPSRFRTAAEAAPYAHNPRMLANHVYNGRMGNALNSDDGWNFRGRGATQTTGRNGYAALSNKLGLDFIGSPQFVNNPKYFLECGVADFIICGCLFPAISDDIHAVTVKLNGGTTGLAERQMWLDKWKAMNPLLPVISPSIVPVAEEPKETLWASLKSFFSRG